MTGRSIHPRARPYRPRSMPVATSVGVRRRRGGPTLSGDGARAPTAAARRPRARSRPRPAQAVDARLDRRPLVLPGRASSAASSSSPRRADRMSDDLQFYDLVGGALACLALWWRRRWPLGVALFALAMNTFSSSASIAGAIALFTVAVHRRAPVAIALRAALARRHADPARRSSPRTRTRRCWVSFVDRRAGHRRRHRMGHVRARAAPARALAARPRRAGRGRAAAAGRAGAPAGAGADRARDARRARAPDLAAQPARGRARVPPRRVARGGRPRGRRDPRQRARGAGGPAHRDRRAARRGAATATPSARSRRWPTCRR